MKQLTTILITLAALFILSGCSPDPVEYSIDEMKFTIADKLTLEEDEQVAKEELVESGSFHSVEDAAEFANDILYFHGEDYDISVISTLVSYHESQLEDCIKAIFENDKSDISEDITIDGVPAKIGYYTIDNYETHFIYTLKNGIFYIIELSLYEGNTYPEGYLETLAETITFDESLLETQTADCGDVQITVQENYIPFGDDEEDEFYDERYFAKYGKTETDEVQYGVSYSKGETLYGYNADDVMDEFSSSYENPERFTIEGSIGTYECMKGIDADGSACTMAVAVYEGNMYWIETASAEALTMEELQALVDSIKEKE